MTEIATDASQGGIHIAYFIRFCMLGYQLKCSQSSDSVFQLFTSFGRPHNFVNIKTLYFFCLQAYIAYPVINETPTLWKNWQKIQRLSLETNIEQSRSHW